MGWRTCYVGAYKSKIPDADLLKILRFVSQNKKRIIEQWNKHFGV